MRTGLEPGARRRLWLSRPGCGLTAPHGVPHTLPQLPACSVLQIPDPPPPNTMNSPAPKSPKPDVSGLIAAVSRNKETGSLGQFLEPQRWSVLADYLRCVVLPKGNLLISQGALDRKLYFLESGSLKVDLKTEAGLVQLAILAPGTVVGEGSFFSHLARSSTVVAYSECKVWELSPENFAALSKQYPSVALALAMALGATLASRMLDLSKRIAVT